MITITEAKAALDAAIGAHGVALKKISLNENASQEKINEYINAFDAMKAAELAYIGACKQSK